MALRALLFCKSPETSDAMTAILKDAGVRTEVCSDIFAAMEKGTKQPYSAVIVDWMEQPEAGFLLKRARESGVNRNAAVIAIVHDDPSPEEQREHRLEFLIYRPISADEAGAVLAKACQQMEVHAAALPVEARAALEPPPITEPTENPLEDPNLVSIASDLPESLPRGVGEEDGGEGTVYEERAAGSVSLAGTFKPVLAAGFLVVAVALLWTARGAFQYLKQTPEGTMHVLRQSVAALFFADKSGTQSVGTAMTDAQQDAYFTRSPAGNAQPSGSLSVVSADIRMPDAPMPLRPALDLPLPTPELHVDPAPARPVRAALPDSIRTSAPVARPMVAAVNPQLLTVSTPPPTSTPAWQQAGEPVHLTEDSARALIVQSVNPEYPPEALPQKLQGPVVLQVAIGRDGTVQELKLVKGYFVLAKAAIAAVKQWKFKPYSVNGKPLEAQTVITVTFTYPSS